MTQTEGASGAAMANAGMRLGKEKDLSGISESNIGRTNHHHS